MSDQPTQGEVFMYLLALPAADTIHDTGAETFILTEVVQNCLQANEGKVVQYSLEPPGILIGFREADHALKAAMALRNVHIDPQQSESAPDYIVMLDAPDLTGETPVLVEMADHLRSVAHAGTIFISVGALALLKNLPDTVTLTQVQSHNEEITTQLFEVRTDRLPLPGVPAHISTFVGRETEVKQIRALLTNKRLVTISGPGGSGKTRLALFIAEEVRASFPDGMAIADLSPISDPSLVTYTLATALGLREEPGTSLQSTVLRRLKSRTALVVLDNCEHLIEACAQLTANILQSCSGITFLATSREPLGVYGETIWRLAPLPVPHPDRVWLADDLVRFAATRLFLERAASAQPTFRLPDSQVRVVAEICRRLDGMPLAIELAAAQVKFLSVQQLSDRLHDALRLLVTRSRTTHARQRTLLLTMDWSYDLLTEEEQALFRRLAVFAGGASLEAIEAVCVGGMVQAESILSLLAQLVDKSLVIVDDQQSETRYHLLETVRQYGLMRLVQLQEEVEMRQRHFCWVLALVERARAEFIGPQQSRWLSRLEEEHGNLRAALTWCQTASLRPDDKVSLVVGLLRFYYIRGHSSEGLAHFTAVLDESAGCSPRLMASALKGMGILAAEQGDTARAVGLFERSYEILIDLDDQRELFSILQHLASLAVDQGKYDRAEELFEQCLAIARTTGNEHDMAHAVAATGRLAYYTQDYKRARPLGEDAVQRFREMGDLLGIAKSLCMLGDILRDSRDYLGAYQIYRDALPRLVEIGSPVYLAECLEATAILLERCGSPAEATQLLGTCHASREKVGVPIYPSDRAVHESTVTNLKRKLGVDTFVRLWEKGKKLSLEDWVSRLQPLKAARDYETAASFERLVPAEGDRLTDREREVAALVSKGLTDKEIGSILHISSRTVDGHMRSIFAKVNVPSRAALAAWTVEQRLK